ncbi:HNH endonuclease [Neobacillus bataviensis]|uniref:HNH endonuclease n=1 Tax=Neobacillus bataviensis TaxID=220685 RepID=A0A561DZI6_9BACI|nr:HNH endonuclease signature motif containing protein [Neobacillus bataviensis]TWE08740.1 HNH endonuclease [Neobacillus bataviensis]
MNLIDLLSKISTEHQHALSWFVKNSGEEDVPFTPKFDGIQIVSPAQGIYKPASSVYALSVKETLGGSYPDQKPVYMADGSWLYAYHQQGDNSKTDRDKLSANRALMKNISDLVPVGVWLQTQSKGRKGAQYKIGIALPVAWVSGFFILVGASPTGDIPDDIPSPAETFTFILQKNQEEIVNTEGFFDPSSVVDERKKALRAIVQRQGQSSFRKKVLHAYGGKCPITGCDIEEALEAAHITPYMGTSTNSVQNGLPLRGDIHTLWDLGYICVDSSDMTVLLHPKLQSSEYGKHHGMALRLPKNVSDAPSKSALDEHRDFCDL